MAFVSWAKTLKKTITNLSHETIKRRNLKSAPPNWSTHLAVGFVTLQDPLRAVKASDSRNLVMEANTSIPKIIDVFHTIHPWPPQTITATFLSGSSRPSSQHSNAPCQCFNDQLVNVGSWMILSTTDMSQGWNIQSSTMWTCPNLHHTWNHWVIT